MIPYLKNIVPLPALSLLLLTGIAMEFSAAAWADDPPPSSSSPPEQGLTRHHNNPAFQACKKQADDKNMEPGDARKEFIRNCVKTAAPSS